MSDLKEKLDFLVKKYETPDFIKSDPIKFPRKYANIQDIEISALISSALAYGKREVFIEKLEYIHKILGASPYEFCKNFNEEACEYYFKNFKYRFNTGADIIILLKRLNEFYSEYNSFDTYLAERLNESTQKAKQAVGLLSDYLRAGVDLRSYSYLFPHPCSNSACKRLNLLLKWMVRKSSVDIGIWNALQPKDLIIPLDVHVAKVARILKLTSRKANDWQTAEEITQKLRDFDINDPVKYDFALFDIGIENIAISNI